MSTRPRRNATDWVEAALDALAAEGPDGMGIDAVAKRLGVTKGSFYWHFADRQAWRRATATHLATVRTDERLSQLATIDDPMQRFARARAAAFEIASIDRAVRDWARDDPEIAEQVRIGDAKVLSFLHDAFVELGLAPADADLRARLVLWAFVGHYQVALPPPPEKSRNAEMRLLTLLTQAPAPSAHDRG